MKTRNNSRNCGWSETRQQHSKHETKRTVNIYDVKTYKKSLKNGETVAGVELNNNTESAKQSER